ncbi:hypothetical protein DL93DRAFT_2071797 [Clavulina sp. PMI_390]|nr:hypothetical protein DL93DRAFT_2071797 [Clavulina sp. PMI_390]
MTSLNIIVSEAGPHHSWTVDHLTSLPSFSLDVMQSLAVSRTNLPFNSEVDEIASLQPVPRELLDRLKEESVSPTQLNLDWWGWDPSDLKELLASNHQLEELSITFDAPFSKLLTLTSTFANMQNLRTFRVRVPEHHAPGVPVQQYHLHASQSPVKHLSGLPTPAASPVASSRGMARSPSSPADKPSSLPTGQPAEPPFQTPPATPSDTFSTLSLGITPMSPPTSGAGCEPVSQTSHSVNSAFGISRNSSSNDASFPNPRDIQKFARRCPKLETLDWYGRNGRGSWTITREGSSAFTNGGALNGALSASTTFTPASEGNATAHSVNTVTVKAEHVPPYFPSPSDQLQAARESEAETWGWESTIEREGAEWTGPAAEVWAAEQAEKEALAAEEKEREQLAIAAAAAEAQAQAAAEKAKEKEGRQRAASVSNEGAKRKGKGSNKLPKLDTSGNGSTGAGEGSNASSNSRRRSSYAGAINSPTKALSSSTPIKSSESGKTIRRPSTNSTSPSTTNGSGTSSNWRSSGRKRAGSVGVNGSVNGGGLKLDVGVPSAAGNARSPTNASPTKAAAAGGGSVNRAANGLKSGSRPNASAGGRKTSSRSS